MNTVREKAPVRIDDGGGTEKELCDPVSDDAGRYGEAVRADSTRRGY